MGVESGHADRSSELNTTSGEDEQDCKGVEQRVADDESGRLADGS